MSLLRFLLMTASLQDPSAPDAGKTPSGSSGGILIPLLLIAGIFYLVLILPERRKQKRREAMLAAIKKGDKVMTSSGIYATVAQIQEDQITLQVADGVRIRFSRAAIQDVLDGEGQKEKGKASGS